VFAFSNYLKSCPDVFRFGLFEPIVVVFVRCHFWESDNGAVQTGHFSVRIDDILKQKKNPRTI